MNSTAVLLLFGLVLLVTLLQLCLCQEVHHTPVIGKTGTKCYDSLGRPQRCIPEFENAAFNVRMESTNTCGEDGDIEFCPQTGQGVKKSCEICRWGDHSSIYLTDINKGENITWWQSETMYEGIQYPMQVNLTLNLAKAFDITYVRILFYSPRPESFSIYKRTSADSPWLPYQFYSATCRDTYSLPDSLHTVLGEETRALCTSEYSDISPLRGGNIAFSTLEGRPGAYSFDTNAELQEWVTATDIKISLDRLNTFGDELFGDPKVLKSYFYAIADVAVGARCKCNGHASECVSSTGPDGIRTRVCQCEHNTAGPDCNECLPFYNDRPWGRASASNSNECKECDCNGYSDKCYFDKDLYERTGHGGHCIDCAANRAGPNCERCRENYYQREDGYCIPCDCSETGSRSLQCNREGQCQCKPGVTGEKCDHCEANHYDFGTQGCKSCGCSVAGSIKNTPTCDPDSGVCLCKENVEGKRCRECKPGYFNLDVDNEFGCTLCFCYGHSSECTSAPGYSKIMLNSFFDRSDERWSAQDEHRRKVALAYNGLSQDIRLKAPGREPIFFIAPDRFLGDQRASYNHDLRFTLHIGEPGPSPTAADIILESNGMYVTNTIFGQGNNLPSIGKQEYKFRLHEHPDYGWKPKLSARAFMSILTNLTSIRIRGTYTPQGTGFLDNFHLETAIRGAAGQSANWIEHCECPTGYVGQFCESCSPGYRHSPALGGPFKPCVPCDCNKHANICEAETGKCICQHNTAGDNCELCAKGYYGNALIGSQFDCKPCLCPNNGACIQLPDETLVCLECPAGYAGPKCDLCSDGYFGDPTGRFGTVQLCQPCECNLNIDLNAVGNCNRTTGECLKCIHNTGSPHCDQCLPGYYGDALSVPKGDCKPCECYPAGTEESNDGPPLCDQLSGQCHCKPFVLGRNCDQCEDGYFNIGSGEGCETCECNSVGSLNHTCNIHTGQCFCRPGVTGLRCDKCEIYKYGFSREGCKSCDCDDLGSKSKQCDPQGQCPCLNNVEGRKCDRCKENKYNRQEGCVDCPPCYNLVQDAVHAHQKKLDDLEKLLEDISNNPTVIDDKDFEEKLNQVQDLVRKLNEDAKDGTGSDISVTEKLNNLRKRLNASDELLDNINNLAKSVEVLTSLTQGNISESKHNTEQAKQLLNNATDYVNNSGQDALERATQKSKEFGHQSTQMSDIAHKARTKSEAVKADADRVQEAAAKAKNVSTQAYEIAKKAIEKQTSSSYEIGSLKNVIIGVRDKLMRTKNQTQDAHSRANDVHKEAWEILHDISNIPLPDVNIKQIKKDADWHTIEAKKVMEEIENLQTEYQPMIDELHNQLDIADDLLLNATEQQQVIDELISDADLAKAQAEQAVKLGDATLTEAQNTYKTLNEFDQHVQDSKSRAQEAMGEINDIERSLNETSLKIKDTKDKLHGAEANAQQARKIAQEAQKKYAEQASIEAKEIREKADATKMEAGKLKLEADNLADRVGVTGNRLKSLEDQAVNDEDLISEAKRKVGQAETDTLEATKQVNKALEEVQFIINILDDLPSIDTTELDELERRLRQAEKELESANLDARIAQVREEKQKQIAQIELYENEIKRLKLEVDNIKDISDSLPDQCYKRIKLEP